jgi:hypothetical protein
MELGIYTFAENTPDPVTGRTGRRRETASMEGAGANLATR